MKFLLASLKTLTSSKSCPESRIKVLFRLSFALIGPFFLMYIGNRLSEQFSESQGDFGTESRNKLSEEGTGRLFTISK